MPNLRQKADSSLKASLHLPESQLQVQQMKANQKSRQFSGGVLYHFPHITSFSACFGLCLYTAKVVLE